MKNTCQYVRKLSHLGDMCDFFLDPIPSFFDVIEIQRIIKNLIIITFKIEIVINTKLLKSLAQAALYNLAIRAN